ncbi:MAG: molybdopterin molybdotransferase MoeA [Bacillota bacterium]
MVELFNVISVAKARELIYVTWPFRRQLESIPLTAALGRVLARNIVAAEDVPGFNRSTMDGFAVRARDTFGASESMPAYLAISGEISMGQEASLPLEKGMTTAIATGGMLPPGADAVVMIEHTEQLDAETIGILRPVAPGENTVSRGEDIAIGETVLSQDHRMRPQDLGILATIGQLKVEVYTSLRVGILSTGNEVIPPEQALAPGLIRDVNSYTLGALVQADTGIAHTYGIIPDDFHKLLEVLKKAVSENHLVLISGGSSVGTRDLTVQVLQELGTPGILFHGISLRPGKPTLAAVAGETLILGLPGHPVSAMTSYEILARPLVLFGKYGLETARTVWATLNRNVASGAGREDHVRVSLREDNRGLVAEPVLGKSGLISVMVEADGVIVIPLETEGLYAGSQVAVRLYG